MPDNGPRQQRQISSAATTYSSMAGMENSSRRSFLAKISALALAARVRGWAATPAGLIFAGTYTDKGQHQPGASTGFAGMRTRAPWRHSGWRRATVNPSFLALSPDRRHLYAVNEVDELSTENKAVRSLPLPSTGRQAASHQCCFLRGGGPCKVAVDSPGKPSLSPTMAAAAPHPFGC